MSKNRHGMPRQMWDSLTEKQRQEVRDWHARGKPAKRIARKKRDEKRRRARLAKMSYWQYIKSADWKRLRKQKLKQASYRCQCCGRRASQVHHERYPPGGQWWKDKLTNLQAVCGKCHQDAHSDPETPW